MRGVPETVVFACCALSVLMSASNLPLLRDDWNRDPVDVYARHLAWDGPHSRPPGLTRDFQQLGFERWLLVLLAGAGVAWLLLRRRRARTGLLRLSLLAVLTGAAAGAQLPGFGILRYEVIAGALSGIRLGFGLGAILLSVSLLLLWFEPRGGHE